MIDAHSLLHTVQEFYGYRVLFVQCVLALALVTLYASALCKCKDIAAHAAREVKELASSCLAAKKDEVRRNNAANRGQHRESHCLLRMRRLRGLVKRRASAELLGSLNRLSAPGPELRPGKLLRAQSRVAPHLGQVLAMR